MTTNLNVTELDFDQIKQNLKNYLQTQSEFNDYDFDGSGLSILLDVLAYNTHYNAIAAHYSLSEAFLDSAQIRGNVVTRAKLLGYTPRSRLAPVARVNIVVDVAAELGAKPATLTLQRGTRLNTNVDGEEYQFVVVSNQTATRDQSNDEQGNPQDIYTFSNVKIVEGSYKTIKYRVDNDIENQKFQIPDQDVDTSTLRVRVQQNTDSQGFDIYELFESLLNIDSSSQIYHLQENANGYFETYFGDGILGRMPSDNNIVTLDYVYTQADASNGANVFEMVDAIGGFSSITVSTVTPAAGGAEKETLESIRYNAPLTYTSQNRAVTADDYRAIIQRQFPNISSISAWGGENADPPDFGKVFIAIKPITSDLLTTEEKNQILDDILAGKNVVSITPEIVDPNFTFLELDVFFKYNPNLTDRTEVDLLSVVRDTISDYDFNNLNKFDGVFRHSQILRAIDNADPSIQNSTVRPFMFKTITPSNVSGENDFELTFTAPFYTSSDAGQSILSSTAFKINGIDHFFGDSAISGTTNRKIYVYKIVNSTQVIAIADVGRLYPTTGKIELQNFTPDTTDTIRITVIPNSLDLAPKRDQLISIDPLRVNITADIDTIALAGSSGTIDYDTTGRFR